MNTTPNFCIESLVKGLKDSPFVSEVSKHTIVHADEGDYCEVKSHAVLDSDDEIAQRIKACLDRTFAKKTRKKRGPYKRSDGDLRLREVIKLTGSKQPMSNLPYAMRLVVWELMKANSKIEKLERMLEGLETRMGRVTRWE